MNTKWVVIANAAQAQIYSVCFDNHNAIESIDLLQSFTHPQSRAKVSDLVTDKPGLYSATGSIGGTHDPHSDPKRVEHDKFAKQVVDFLEKNRSQNKISHLILVANPRFYGLMMQHVTPSLKQLVKQVVEKDIMLNNQNELRDFIQNIIFEKIPC